MNFRVLAGAAVVALGMAGCVDMASTYPGGYDRHVQIVNQTGRTIYRFYGSNVGTSSWEEDILGTDVLGAGQSVVIDFNDGTGYCNFDFKIEFADGNSYVDENINVCTVGTYTLRK